MNSNNYDSFFEGRNVLVTGGAGFIGSHLTQHLARLGASVRVFDDFSSGHRSNLSGMNVSIIQESILNTNAIHNAIQGCSIVFHEAAFVSVAESFEHPEKCLEINVKGTSNVLDAAINTNCSRVIFASSAACYGSHPNLPSKETDVISAESPYAQSKVAGEQMMRDATVDTVSLRYFNVFGHRQNPKSEYAAVVSAFADALSHNQPPTIFGTGSQSRDFANVDTIVHANLLAASHLEPLNGEIFNVGTGTMMSLLDLLQAMTNTNNVDINFQPQRIGDVFASCANIEKINSWLGYSPTENTAKSLQKLLNPKQQ